MNNNQNVDILKKKDILTDEQEIRMKEGFEQITRGEYITANDYISKRGLEM